MAGMAKGKGLTLRVRPWGLYTPGEWVRGRCPRARKRVARRRSTLDTAVRKGITPNGGAESEDLESG